VSHGRIKTDAKARNAQQQIAVIMIAKE